VLNHTINATPPERLQHYKKCMYSLKQAIINKFDDMISCDVKHVSLFVSRELNQGRWNSGRAGEGGTKVEGNIN